MDRKALYLIVAMGALQAACAASQRPDTDVAPTPRPGLLSRNLSAAEKAALAHALSRTFKDPPSVQFQWGPVWYLPGMTTTEYCGIVNGKNSYGGYTGYQMFYATLDVDAKGQYTSGLVEHVDADNATGDQLKENVHYDELCIVAGYGNMSIIPQ
jgi:hypothetical protein